MKLPSSIDTLQREAFRLIELADRLNQKKNEDIVINGRSLIITSPNGIEHTLVVTDGGILGTETAGGDPTAVSELDDLSDVTLTTPAANEVLRYVGGVWVNSSLNDLYYTESEVNALLAGKADTATTLAGYGITDAYTQAQITTLLAGKSDTGHTHTASQITDFSTAVETAVEAGSYDITGNWTFSGTLGFSGIGSQSTVAGGLLFIDGVNNVRFVTAPATDGVKRFLDFESDGGGFGWGTLSASDIPSHDIVSGHSASGLTAGHVLRATGTTTFAFAALQAGDLPTHNHDASQITTGILAVDRGGTGLDSTNLTQYDLIYSPNGTGYGTIGVGSEGQVLTVTTGVPNWATPTAGLLGDLSDVTITSAATGDYLRYNGSAWVDSPWQLNDIPGAAPTALVRSDTAGTGWEVYNGGLLGQPLVVVSGVTNSVWGAGNVSWTYVASTPTTLSGYGIPNSEITGAISGNDITPAEVAYSSQVYPSGGHNVLTNQTGTVNLDWDNKDAQMVTMGAGALTLDVDLNANEAGTYTLLVHGPSTGSQNLTITGTGVRHFDGDQDYSAAKSVSTGNAVRFTFIVGRNRADDTNVIEMYSKDLASYPI